MYRVEVYITNLKYSPIIFQISRYLAFLAVEIVDKYINLSDESKNMSNSIKAGLAIFSFLALAWATHTGQSWFVIAALVGFAAICWGNLTKP